ncbi:hypothetical protein KFZ58_05670 [Virgibacillus sp. NKC19-16]|uniref:hypothetical protein n=1 Tax=Virgibacillus salidurans TaxID=2831673 RepID=UPI001F47C906|nr:hypothetical protein [Virgibacillus sp. NKC19-16]UJL47375.1 hypothetical protein KFZ58_05670 [Virgibacillus sp. NKC19-16]
MGEKAIYNTQQIWIKPSHRMFAYFQDMCENSKNLYNTTNFYIRQVYTGLTTNKPLQPLQEEVLDTIHANVEKINAKQLITYEKRLAKEKKKTKEKQSEVSCNLFEMPSLSKSNNQITDHFLHKIAKV